MTFITKCSVVKIAMFIFLMVMNHGNTSANVTDVTSNTEAADLDIKVTSLH